ncbi:MAG: ABC transporter ATP-binding protein, partial [Solirubrobacterales bacterium]
MKPTSTQTPSPPTPPVALRAVEHRFGALSVIDGLHCEVGAGEVLGLVGPSGCGKSTLLDLIGGLAEPAGGEISVGDATSADRRLRRCALMPQRDCLLPWLDAADNAALALTNRGIGRAQARDHAAERFAAVGLASFENAWPREMSGGMRQRVAFLRTLLADKPVLLLDEPFAALDAITRGEMQRWLASRLAEAGRTVVFVTHDIEEALYLCDRVAVLDRRPTRVLDVLASPRPRDPDRAGALADPAAQDARRHALDLLAGVP